MNKIFFQQRCLQRALEPNQASTFTESCTTGVVYDRLQDIRFFIDEEITELMEQLGDGTRDIHKPWKPNYYALREVPFQTSEKIRGEAIDALCFAINLCLSVGIDENNIDKEYNKVYRKNVDRVVQHNLPFPRNATLDRFQLEDADDPGK